MLSPSYELSLLNSNKFNRIIGIDEVGRGAWAGPVAVGAYVFQKSSPIIEGVADSKQLTVIQREQAYLHLAGHQYRVIYKQNKEIDRLGIVKSVEKLILEVIAHYYDGRTLFLVDGKFRANFGRNVEVTVKGDGIFYSIAAASILAKVERDRLMVQKDREFPGYEFAKHKGYGTKLHQERLQTLGATHFHRASFRPIYLLSELQEED